MAELGTPADLACAFEFNGGFLGGLGAEFRELEMILHRVNSRIGRATIAAAAALAALVGFGGPHWAGGYWRGAYFSCLCSADMVAEFRDGQVVTHLDPWPSSADSPGISRTISSNAAGAYRRTGWNSFEWSQRTNRGGVSRLTVKPGWLVCRIEDPETREVWWGYREYNISRILRIRAHRPEILQPRAPVNGRLPSGCDFDLAATAGGPVR